jgi:hypothetical protein
MRVLLFLVGSMSGVIAGGAVCLQYLRKEIAADVGPRLKRIQLQLDNIESDLNLAFLTRSSELARRPSDPGRQDPR